MTHVAFETAGSGPGIEIWTIENFEPVAINKNCYGNFFNGDAYIVLKTTGDSNSTLSYDAHFWLGSKSSQDKRGAAAIWTVTLDDMLNGKAVHHREPQGYESAVFLGYFKPAIRYVEGGNESGFTEVETNAGAEKRLLKLSGCETMRIEEVPAESTSLTSDHCFILEVDHDIFVLMPEGAKATQKRKIISVANSLRDDYHNGRATIEIIDDFSSDEDYGLFFDALGSGSKDDLQSDDSSNSYAREDMSAVYLYRVLTGDDIDVIAISKPYKQKQLSSDEVYILDTPDIGVYIWLGSGVDADVKKNYLDIATKYLDIKSYPSWVSITRVSENSESSTFKQYFHDWDSAGTIRAFASELDDAGYGTGDDDSSIAKLIGKSATARGLMPDSGDGNLVVTRFPGEEDVTDTVTAGSVLYNSEVYIVKYQYTNSDGNDAWVVYAWIGKNASKDDIESATKLVNDIEDEIEKDLTVVRIPQGQECKHFLNIFKGNLAILFGNKDNDYKPENSSDNYDDTKTRLFRVEGTTTNVDMRAVQVPESASILEDDDVFILDTEGAVYVWNGKESNEKEQAAALGFVKVLLEGREPEVVDQGSEPEEFWDALGGAADEKEDPSGWKLAVNRRVTTPTTLTAATVKVTGNVTFEDLDTQFTQQDLSDDGMYILDTGEELYLWQGKNIPERVKTSREAVVEHYIEDDGMDRTADTALIVVVKQGSEPSAFKKHFSNWDDELWENQTSYEDLKNETKAANSK